MRSLSALLLVQFILLPLTIHAQTSEEKLSESQIEGLMETLNDMRMELELLKARVQSLEQTMSTIGSAGTGVMPWPGEGAELDEEQGPDRAALRAIKFPEYPSDVSVRAYIREIEAVSRKQGYYSADDPQVQMLVRVGREYVHLLVEAATGDMFSFYVIEAIKRVATDDHKTLILENLPYNRELVDVVLHRAWVEEARPILIQELEEGSHLPIEWYEAVAQLNDPSTYDELVEAFVRGPNHAMIYHQIARLPGIRLDEPVAEVWESVQSKMYERDAMAAIALQYGYIDALERMMRNLDDPILYGFPILRSARQLVIRHTDASGSNADLRAWFESNKNRLVFDVDEKKFRVR